MADKGLEERGVRRLNINVDGGLLKRFKVYCAERDQTMTEVIIDFIKSLLERR